jgi:hypothetical protein
VESRIPGTYASGYKLSPLRGWERTTSEVSPLEVHL